jgi:hypothetical protein
MKQQKGNPHPPVESEYLPNFKYHDLKPIMIKSTHHLHLQNDYSPMPYHNGAWHSVIPSFGMEHLNS